MYLTLDLGRTFAASIGPIRIAPHLRASSCSASMSPGLMPHGVGTAISNSDPAASCLTAASADVTGGSLGLQQRRAIELRVTKVALSDSAEAKADLALRAKMIYCEITAI